MTWKDKCTNHKATVKNILKCIIIMMFIIFMHDCLITLYDITLYMQIAIEVGYLCYENMQLKKNVNCIFREKKKHKNKNYTLT